MSELTRSQKARVAIRSFKTGVDVIGLRGYYRPKDLLGQALADSLRDEVNPLGIRVLSVYPGRTATPMQESIFEGEGRAWTPERLLQPEDVSVEQV